MRVLITELDLCRSAGGGQTVYRKLIETHPEIEYWYFRSEEPQNLARPPNARTIPYKETYKHRDLDRGFFDIDPPKWIYEDFIRASNIAASASGMEFDVVEMPDFQQYGSMLRPALIHHGVKFHRLLLSLHGSISRTIRFNWATEGSSSMTLMRREEMQYLAVDGRYGISKSYLDEWRNVAGIEGHYLNPMRFVSPPRPWLPASSSDPPILNFIGRTEKCKGPDIFVELVWWLPRSLFSTANIIGPDSIDPSGVSSRTHLHRMKMARLQEIRLLPSASQNELYNQFCSRSVTFLPSRFDTLNLIALESIFAGCPTIIGSSAGVCRFLRENFSKVPFISIDVGRIYSALPAISSLLETYDRYRDQLCQALAESSPEISGPSLAEIYERPPSRDASVSSLLDRWHSRLQSFQECSARAARRSIRARASNLARFVTTPGIRRKLRQMSRSISPRDLKAKLRRSLTSARLFRNAWLAEQALRGRRLVTRYRQIFNCPEQNDGDLTAKIRLCWEMASEFLIDRVRLWREIARIERLRGNDLFAATYELRVLRALGEDPFGLLEGTATTLQDHRFPREALTARAMYGPAEDKLARCSELLQEALDHHRSNPSREFEFVDDRRTAREPRVSVIVSLYKAAPKLRRFLEALGHQSVLKAGAAELVVIDSGSPDDQYRVFQETTKSLGVDSVYARSRLRETIQTAWNRGIALSRAPYLTFLGVDETVLPNTLEQLAAELDADPTVDWVQANSIVTEVDSQGNWVRDIMTYDRSTSRQDIVYLETCYLSSVGALYRKSIHERVGYYDETFAAAGDTEFKNRILPFIKAKFIPRTLGIFWNYPDDRTTQSPLAEVEDLRAWYLHRTLGGVKYAFANKNPEDAALLLQDALCYRKSFCAHWSTDLEYAATLGDFLEAEAPGSKALRHIPSVRRLLEAYRALEWLPVLSRRAPFSAARTLHRVTNEAITRQKDLACAAGKPTYFIYNDNRYEQHSHVWRSPPRPA